MQMIPGHAEAQATQLYAEQQGAGCGKGHYSEFLRTGIQLSSIGAGTFPGEASPAQDARLGQLLIRAVRQGINVIDTASHYRYGRSLAAVGAAVRALVAGEVPRQALFLVSKGGFLTLRGGKPTDFAAWFQREIVDRGLGRTQDLAGEAHLLSPAYIDYQLDLSRRLMGVETLDAFLVDQPEVHIPVIGKERLNQKLLPVFAVLERAVREGRIRNYGIATFNGFRVETDHPLFESLASLLGLAEKAAREVDGESAEHHFRLIQLPFNAVMNEGFTRFNQATGQGNIASTLQAAYQLGLYVMGSHGMMKGHLARQGLDVLRQALPELANDAQRALQCNRSTPGLGTTLVGLRSQQHLDDVLAVCRQPVMSKKSYLALYQRAG